MKQLLRVNTRKLSLQAAETPSGVTVTRTTVAERNDRVRRGGLPRGVVPLRVRGHHGAAGGQVVLPRLLQALQHVLR